MAKFIELVKNDSAVKEEFMEMFRQQGRKYAELQKELAIMHNASLIEAVRKLAYKHGIELNQEDIDKVCKFNAEQSEQVASKAAKQMREETFKGLDEFIRKEIL